MDAEKQEPFQETPPENIQENVCESRKSFTKEEILEEVKKQLLLAGPMVVVSFCMCFIPVISITIVGHLGELALSSASLATTFAGISGFTVLRGMGSALETFSGQAYGAKQYHMLGVFLQRGAIVLLAMSIPIAILYANVAHIFRFFRQNPEISTEAGHFARFLIPVIICQAFMESHIRFLQTQNQVNPLMVTSGVATLLHILFCWVLVFKSSLKSAGAALASSLSFWVQTLLLILYVQFSPSCKQTWTGFSKEAFHGIPSFLKLAIPSALMLGLQFWSLEIMVLLSGLLPNPKLETSVFSISFNSYNLISMIPLGLGAAVSTRVSNELGAGRPRAARLAVYVVVIMVMTEGIIAAVIMISGRKIWGYLFSQEKRVVNDVGEMFLLLAPSHLIDGIQSVLSGTCRGCGWQKVGASVNLGAYYLVGVPASVVLAFVHHIGGKGLWIGIMIALVVQASCLLIITLCIDWNKQAKQAKDRVSSATIDRNGNDNALS